MVKTVSPAKIEKMAAGLIEWWYFIKHYLHLTQELDVVAFLKKNPQLTGILAVMKMEGGEWEIEKFLHRLVQAVMPDVLEKGDEFLLSCYVAFERFPEAITGQLPITIPTEGQTARSKKTDQDPVKIFKGMKNLKEFMDACDNDPRKVLNLFDKGAEQCGSARQFSEAIGISNAYFYANRKRLQAMAKGKTKGVAKKAEKKSAKAAPTPAPDIKQDPLVLFKGLKNHVEFLAKCGNDPEKTLAMIALGVKKSRSTVNFFRAIGLSSAQYYTNQKRLKAMVKEEPAQLASSSTKGVGGSEGKNEGKKFRGHAPVKSSLGTKSSEDRIGDAGIEAELASHLTASRLDETQVAGLALLAEEHKVDSVKDLLDKISKGGTDSTGAARILAENEVLPAAANHISFMRFKTAMAV